MTVGDDPEKRDMQLKKYSRDLEEFISSLSDAMVELNEECYGSAAELLLGVLEKMKESQ